MGRIYFRRYYTQFVEHCFHIVVRKRNNSDLSANWKTITTHWLDNNLSQEDKEFIFNVFDEKYYNVTEGLVCCYPEEDYEVKRRRLFYLERQFAIDNGIITPHEDTCEVSKWD